MAGCLAAREADGLLRSQISPRPIDLHLKAFEAMGA